MKSILFQVTSEDVKFLSFLKPVLSGRCNLALSDSSPSTVMEVVMRMREKGCTSVATTSPKLLKLLLGIQGEKLPSVDDYSGSIIEKFNTEFLILNPVQHLITVPYGRFLYERYFSKFLHPEKFLQMPPFEWELFTPSIFDKLYADFQTSNFIAIDIETGREEERVITCVGFTAVFIDAVKQSFKCRTVVVPATDEFNLVVIRMLCELPSCKVFQNGKYDNAYLLRYRIAVNQWGFDTAHMFHAWYSELPKRLDFIVSFLLRKWQYWKDESSTGNLQEYYQYNAKDAFTTAMSWLALMLEVPPFAIQNYLMEFPQVFPCLTTEMIGIKADQVMMAVEEKRFAASLEIQLAALRRMVGNPHFNPSSSDQVLKLFAALGSGDIKNTKPPSRDKVASRHALNKRLMAAIEKYRKDRKLLTSYLREYDPKEEKHKLWHGRFFYTVNPHGTDTGRMAGKESHFWCGVNIHNQPRNRKDIQVKKLFIADEGFFFGEADGEQAEARGTGYLSGDTALISAVDDVTKDFHSKNASAFFGLPYQDICSSTQREDGSWKHERLLIDIIDIAKRTNHGSNYNMGAEVMLDTMGIENVLKAKRLLKLPASFSPLNVTQFLLNKYAETYNVVKGSWYDKVVSDVNSTHMLIGPTGWTRYCFGSPSGNKRILNSYVAHPPQSLNAMILNKAYWRVFFEIWLPHHEDFKLGPQIHDSIAFQYRTNREDLAWKVKDFLEIPVPVKDSFGITRTLLVPAALKGGSNRWSDIKSLEK